MNYWIDTHAHIYAKEFDVDRTDMLARAMDANVDKIYMPNIDHSSIDAMMEVELRNPHSCFSTMGLHPCSVKKDFEKELYIIEDWLRRRKFVAIGEIGTDLYWDKTFWEQQKEAFNIQVKWAIQYNLPVIIHCRESLDETITLVEELTDGKLRGIFHCFGGSIEQAKRIVTLGFLLGIGGVVTFKKAAMDEVLPHIDEKHLVFETDSPYLAPVPYRGKRNEPSYIPLIASKVASIKNIDMEELKSVSTQTALTLFAPNAVEKN